MTYTRIGVVTGANKGIGFAIVRQLALQYPASTLNNGPLLIYLAARDKSKGETALKALQNDTQLREAKALTIDGGFSEIRFHVLDITNNESRKSFADYLRQTHADGVDFCINNAGIALDGFDINVVKKTLDCNYYSTLAMCHAFLPLLKSDGRLVNVASTSGTLDKYSPHIRERFQSSRTEAEVTSIMQDFQSAVEANREKEAGFPSAGYAVSKAGLIGVTRAFAENIREEQPGILVNCCCPGFVATSMTKQKGTKTPDAGAQTPVTLALGDITRRSGLFWKDEKVVSW